MGSVEKILPTENFLYQSTEGGSSSSRSAVDKTADRQIRGTDRRITRKSDATDRVTIVLTTSPCESTPCTHLIEQVFASIDEHAGLRRSGKIIVCDGYKVNDDSKVKFRNGVVSEHDVEKYEQYINRLAFLTKQPSSCLFGAKLLVLENRHGFAYALWRGIMRVTTEYVLVAQHDRDFRRPVCISSVVHALDMHKNSEDPISYIGFPTSTTLGYDRKTAGRPGLKGLMLERTPIEVVGDRPAVKNKKNCDDEPMPVGSTADGKCPSHDEGVAEKNTSSTLSLLPLVQFYDSMHLARTHWYLSRIYGTQRFCSLPRGCFIESPLGQFMFTKACGGGIDAVKKFGCYILDDAVDLPSVGHINGRSSFNASIDCDKFDLSCQITSEDDWAEVEAGLPKCGDWISYDWGSDGRPGDVLSGHGSFKETMYKDEHFLQ